MSLRDSEILWLVAGSVLLWGRSEPQVLSRSPEAERSPGVDTNKTDEEPHGGPKQPYVAPL